MVRSETSSFSASIRAVWSRPPRRIRTIRNSRSARRMHLSYFEVAIDVAIEAQIAASPTSERRMQTDVIPLGVLEAGVSAKSTRYWRRLDQDSDPCSGAPCNG